jgi:hypothetical protein
MVFETLTVRKEGAVLFRRDSDLFGEGARNPEAQRRIQAAMKHGFQTREVEMDLARILGELTDG